ncbi:MAG: HEPN/Toprim-associated domain-containing protein [Chloroflexi bacterium]|nr:HEPN/Toprim-associated domain-containing protein [Chloroflexota bacterium]
MSSYATLMLGSLELGTSRNGVDPELIWLFRPSDKHVEKATRRNRARLARYIIPEYIDEFDDANPFTCVEYRCTVADLRDRLELKGFTLELAKARFNQAGLQYEEAQVLETASHSETYPQKLRPLTIEKWLDAIARIKGECLTEETLASISANDEQLPLLKDMLQFSNRDTYGFPGLGYAYGLPILNYLLFIRLVIESSRPNEYLVYDLTDLVHAGYVDEEDDCVTLAEVETNSSIAFHQKVIVLTEGRTDKDFLERSVKILYPHLADYFHFFDFNLNKPPGGVGALANLVRAFAAASVEHRILALFDNDAAARDALKNLDPKSLPENIRFCHYPNLAMAENYPTIGPSGRSSMNVNGLAGSLELYLGQDVLENDDGELTPVQWTGYQRRVYSYQGEVLDKKRIQDRFANKLRVCEMDRGKIDSYDWDGIRSILDVMRVAFHRLDAQLIHSEVQKVQNF